MVAMRYYGNVMTTTMSQYFLHLQQYSHRLNLLYILLNHLQAKVITERENQCAHNDRTSFGFFY